ncbi:TPA: TM2 domain-containing protein, partial [Staphylococcus aureus]|nr:TM2 domain-containing protein [Staphylococcus aureus]
MKILKLEILVFTTNLSRIIVKEDLQMKVNKAIYVIVALFLGGLGIHKFYADKFGQGLFHLLFFWTGIPTIISIIHAIFVI